MEQGRSVTWLFFMINLSTTIHISMTRPRRELSIDMDIDGVILTRFLTSSVLALYVKLNRDAKLKQS